MFMSEVVVTKQWITGENQHYSDYGGQTQRQDQPQNTINTLNSVLLRKPAVAKLSKYDLLLGVVKAEAYFAFSGDDVQYGIEADRRSKILRSFVRRTYRFVKLFINSYSYHLHICN